MKNFFTILLLLLISTQALPVKQIGKCIADNQMVEEHPCKKHFNEADDSLVYLKTQWHNLTAVQTVFFRHYPQYTARLVTPPPVNILVPPPNA